MKKNELTINRNKLDNYISQRHNILQHLESAYKKRDEINNKLIEFTKNMLETEQIIVGHHDPFVITCPNCKYKYARGFVDSPPLYGNQPFKYVIDIPYGSIHEANKTVFICPKCNSIFWMFRGD